MTGLKPNLHGPDHANGVDPIPGLAGGIKWAYMPGVDTTVAANGGSGSATTILGGWDGFFYTNAPDVFAQVSKVIGGTTYYGVGYKTDGHYLHWVNFAPTAQSGSRAYDYDIAIYNEPLSETQFQGRPSGEYDTIPVHVDQAGRNFPYLSTADGADPSDPMLWSIINYTNLSWQAGLHLIVVQLDTDNTGI
jgi:hypothetical protein